MAALKGRALIAYLIVCVFWGSTYLAIKVGVGELPPSCSRDCASSRRAAAAGDRPRVGRSPAAPRRRLADSRDRRAVPADGGNAFVVWAEQYTPSASRASSSSPSPSGRRFSDAISPWVGDLTGRRGRAAASLPRDPLLVGATPPRSSRPTCVGPRAHVPSPRGRRLRVRQAPPHRGESLHRASIR